MVATNTSFKKGNQLAVRHGAYIKDLTEQEKEIHSIMLNEIKNFYDISHPVDKLLLVDALREFIKSQRKGLNFNWYRTHKNLFIKLLKELKLTRKEREPMEIRVDEKKEFRIVFERIKEALEDKPKVINVENGNK